MSCICTKVICTKKKKKTKVFTITYFENVNFFTCLSKLNFSLHSAVKFGFFQRVKNTGIPVPVFTGILVAVYRHSVFAIPILFKQYC